MVLFVLLTIAHHSIAMVIAVQTCKCPDLMLRLDCCKPCLCRSQASRLGAAQPGQNLAAASEPFCSGERAAASMDSAQWADRQLSGIVSNERSDLFCLAAIVGVEMAVEVAVG